MPQPKKAARFGGDPAHHALIMSNLATELFRHGRIRTTQAKAKTVQPLAEKMITFAKRGDVHSRRQVLRVVRDRDVVHKLFADIGPAFATRDGGYTRVLKLGPRKGDAAPMALIELVEGVTADASRGDLEEAPKRRWSLRRKRGGTLSATARDREEEFAAAVDRGEDQEPEIDPEGSGRMAEAVPVGSLEHEDDGVEADPQEVEARLAAQEDQEQEDQEQEDLDQDEDDEPDQDIPGEGPQEAAPEDEEERP